MLLHTLRIPPLLPLASLEIPQLHRPESICAFTTANFTYTTDRLTPNTSTSPLRPVPIHKPLLALTVKQRLLEIELFNSVFYSLSNRFPDIFFVFGLHHLILSALIHSSSLFASRGSIFIHTTIHISIHNLLPPICPACLLSSVLITRVRPDNSFHFITFYLLLFPPFLLSIARFSFRVGDHVIGSETGLLNATPYWF
ncbi:hypothetical protein BDW74DRAFT_98778 [Aspergillus multicolor]|uniref:uncharacterized protein n=1 Tax=Aspergillus multicolor TaxID=41759 RepID=UPI003CCD7F40